MTILLPLLLTCLLMSEYLCDRTRAEAVISEETVRLAAGETVSVNGPAGFFFLNTEAISACDTGRRVRVSIDSEDRIGLFSVRTAAESKLTKRNPVKLIRKLEHVKALIKK